MLGVVMGGIYFNEGAGVMMQFRMCTYLCVCMSNKATCSHGSSAGGCLKDDVDV